jgi:hypothetical protein
MPRKTQARAAAGKKKAVGVNKKKKLKPSSDAVRGDNKFVGDLLIRGEAKPLDAKGRLPLEATHELKEGPNGATIERRRFKLF